MYINLLEAIHILLNATYLLYYIFVKTTNRRRRIIVWNLLYLRYWYWLRWSQRRQNLPAEDYGHLAIACAEDYVHLAIACAEDWDGEKLSRLLETTYGTDQLQMVNATEPAVVVDTTIDVLVGFESIFMHLINKIYIYFNQQVNTH